MLPGFEVFQTGKGGSRNGYGDPESRTCLRGLRKWNEMGQLQLLMFIDISSLRRMRRSNLRLDHVLRVLLLRSTTDCEMYLVW